MKSALLSRDNFHTGGCWHYLGYSQTSPSTIVSSLASIISDRPSCWLCEVYLSSLSSQLQAQLPFTCAINSGTITFMKQSYMKWLFDIETDMIKVCCPHQASKLCLGIAGVVDQLGAPVAKIIKICK